MAALTPSQATAGQGTSAQYVVQLTNTGSTDETFSLEVNGLPEESQPASVNYDVDVPPGASNFRDVTLTLTVAQGRHARQLPVHRDGHGRRRYIVGDG